MLRIAVISPNRRKLSRFLLFVMRIKNIWRKKQPETTCLIINQMVYLYRKTEPSYRNACESCVASEISRTSVASWNSTVSLHWKSGRKITATLLTARIRQFLRPYLDRTTTSFRSVMRFAGVLAHVSVIEPKLKVRMYLVRTCILQSKARLYQIYLV